MRIVGVGLCGLRLEPREVVLDHLEKADGIGTYHPISVVNLAPH